ncbi:MAG: hypothetical protein HYZ49_12110 [Chloroflexi bacterium]|nr:hypothetical protein [Chloroflexota bacterium]
MSDFLLDTALPRKETPRLSSFESPPNPALVAEGWERRFTVDGRRLKEYTTLYTALGYEVHIEPLQSAEVGPDCADCRLIALLQFSTVYTRKQVK